MIELIAAGAALPASGDAALFATALAAGAFRGGILLEQSVLSSTWFTVFATFVAINTLGYVAITIAKVLPLPRLRRRNGRNRRAETRGIFPEEPAGRD